MKDVAKVCQDRMGRLNNQLVGVVDKTDATPIEVIIVLHQLAFTIERLFEVSNRPTKPLPKREE